MPPIHKQRLSLIGVISLTVMSILTAGMTSLFATRAARPAKTAAPVIKPAMPEAVETFVFQVGIDKYTSPRVPKLDGCVRDVLDMKQLLIRKFNVPASHFLTLTDEQATHDAIIAGFKKQLIENARNHRDAVVIFQYSGHGSQVQDRTGNKANGWSSTLVPVNSRDLKGSYFDIVDDEIRGLFATLSQYTSNITFIIDACHSGNPTRGAGKTRGIPEDDRLQALQTTKPAPTRGASQPRGGDISALLPRDQRYVAIAATLPHELANEKSFPEIHRVNGALTFYLLKALARARPETTYRQLMAEVANAVTTDYPNQHPQVEGDIGRPVFGGAANREDPFIEIQDVKSDLITIKAGLAQGIAPESIIAVYAADAIRLAGSEKRLTTGKVTAVTPFTASVRLDTMKGVTTQAKAVVISPDFGSIRTRVALAKEPSTRGANPTADTRAKLVSLLEPSRTITLAGDVDLDVPSTRGINWDVIVRQVRFSDWFRDTRETAAVAGAASTRPVERQVFALVGPDATRPLFDFFVELDDPGAAQKIATALEHLANQRSLRSVGNETSLLNGAVKLTLLRVTGTFVDGQLKIEKEESIDLPNDVQDYSFDQGELLRIQIENQSNADLYLTLFDISTDGSIQILYPPAGAAVALPKGARIKPDSLILRLGGPAGYETYKIIASTEKKGPSDYAFLQQAAVTRNSGAVSLANLSDWTTSQINLLISDKVKGG